MKTRLRLIVVVKRRTQDSRRGMCEAPGCKVGGGGGGGGLVLLSKGIVGYVA